MVEYFDFVDQLRPLDLDFVRRRGLRWMANSIGAKLAWKTRSRTMVQDCSHAGGQPC